MLVLHRMPLDRELLATIAGNPHLETISFREHTDVTFSDLLPLLTALAKQPPSMPPLRISANFKPRMTCMADVAECASILGGRHLVLVREEEDDSETGSGSEDSSDAEEVSSEEDGGEDDSNDEEEGA
jgi:hypothetical protein